MKTNKAEVIVNLLGGTQQTADMCHITQSAVSQWVSKDLIPPARMMYLKLARPDVFRKFKRIMKKL